MGPVISMLKVCMGSRIGSRSITGSPTLSTGRPNSVVGVCSVLECMVGEGSSSSEFFFSSHYCDAECDADGW
jgi:hypothetical protein